MDAKQTIEQFLKSGAAGAETTLTEAPLVRAAQSLFTSRGLDCPVQIYSTGGKTYLINRDVKPS